jgi:uncharacterized Fe-S cluster protein YjdI
MRNLQRQAFLGEVVANCQGAELTIVGEPIVHEVERPPFIRGANRRNEHAEFVARS